MISDDYKLFVELDRETKYEDLTMKADDAEKFSNAIKEIHDAHEEDGVNQPSHYDLFPDMTTIQAIEKVLTWEEFIGGLKFNILKYRLRLGNKSSESHVKDLQKAKWYERKLEEIFRENTPK